MDEMLTWAEIETRFPDEWVVIDEPELSDELEVIRGRVVFHGGDRDAGYATMKQLDLHHTAFLFTGDPFPSDALVVL